MRTGEGRRVVMRGEEEREIKGGGGDLSGEM
jgi:hypothetical protein